MQALRLVSRADGGYVVEALPLRMPQVAGVIDPEPFRARARGEGDPLAEAFAWSSGMRTLRVSEAADAALFDRDGALLTFVVAGQLEVACADRGAVRLDPGDLLLVDGGADRERLVRPIGDCQLLQVGVDGDWPGPKARPPIAGGDHSRGTAPCNLQRMYRGADDRSRFRPFDGLFGAHNRWSAVRPLIGLRFIGMADGTFIDWHPEVINCLVVVLSGTLELEVGGDGGAVELFRPGDICLAEDRTGEGHIDRARGHVQVGVLIMADAALWP